MIEELEPLRGLDKAGNVIYEGVPDGYSIIDKINEIIRYLNKMEEKNEK